jgi:ketosteroid isomerase-like protein
MKTTIEIEVEAANRQFYKILDSASLEAMDQIWLHEDWVRCVHPGWDVLIGWKDVRESWDKIFQGDQKMRVSPDDVSVCPIGGAALVTCIENIILFQGADFDSRQTIATNVFINKEGRWLMAHHHASAIPLIMPDPATDTIQ